MYLLSLTTLTFDKLHLVSASYFFPQGFFHRRPDPPIVGASDIGQVSNYFKYNLEYLIVCLLADQSGSQQILLNEGSIQLPSKY